MADPATLTWFLVVVIVIEGVWLAGLSYLMWRGHQARVRARAEARAPPESPKSE